MYAHTEQLTTLFMSQFYAASFPPTYTMGYRVCESGVIVLLCRLLEL